MSGASVLRCVLVTGGLGLGLGLSSDWLSARTQSEQITQPDRWVPLTVEYTIGHPGRETLLRESRRSDGALRVEMPDEPERGLTTITDVAARRYYTHERGAWRLHPLRPLAFEGKPFMTLARDTVGPVSSSDPRVGVVSAAAPGVSFYEFPAPSGNRLILCPELNMLLVWVQFGDGQVRETVRLALGEPDVPFAPPDGTLVEVRSDPRGSGPIVELPSVAHARQRGSGGGE